MKEEWRDISGYEGKYKVSNKGRVKSLKRVVKVKNHPKINRKTIPQKIRKLVDIRGYNYVSLYKNNNCRHIKVARLVAKAFIPNPESKPQTNHINGIKKDDNVNNIEWATASENIQHAYDTGLMPPRLGEDHPGSVLREEDVIKIRKTYKRDDISQNDLAKKYGVDRKTIACVVNRKSWTHI